VKEDNNESGINFQPGEGGFGKLWEDEHVREELVLEASYKV
jgi:hypothetical protein